MSPPRPMSPPWSVADGERVAPPTPQRSETSRNYNNLMIRLIDEESDSDTYQSESFDEHIVFQNQFTPGRPQGAGGHQVVTPSQHLAMPSPAQVFTPQVSQIMTSPSQFMTPRAQLIMTSPGQVMNTPVQVIASPQGMIAPPRVTSAHAITSHIPQTVASSQAMINPAHNLRTNFVQNEDVILTDENNYHYSGSLNELPSSSHMEDEAEETLQRGSNHVMVTRGRARVLMHSASDPGVSRPRHQHLQQHHPRAPGIAVPPPLDHLSEEEVGESDCDGYEDVPRGGRLQRTDSVLTVAHLYEDLLVSTRFRLRVTLTNLTAVVVVAALVVPNTSTILFTAFSCVLVAGVSVVGNWYTEDSSRTQHGLAHGQPPPASPGPTLGLVFGTLFPAYYSYKAVKTKNVKEYVKWMMYWIVFAFFTCFETLTDLFLSFWFPFYYELKILVVLWLLSPATRGSSILYRKFVHPWLTRREDDIDNCIAQAKQQGYSTVIQLGTKGMNYATTVLMQTAIKASRGPQAMHISEITEVMHGNFGKIILGGGGIVNQLRRSYSSGELADEDMNRNVKALPHIPDDDYEDRAHSSGPFEGEPRIRAESDAAYKPRGSSASRGVRSSKTRSADVSDVYYQDVPDEAVQRRRSPRTQDTASRVLSADDLTSGYSSGEADAGDLIYDLRHEPALHTELEPILEPKRSTKVRRTQSLSASTLSLHRSQRAGVRRGELREGLRLGNAGRGSGPVDDLGAPTSYSSSGHPAAPHHGSSFKRSRPGECMKEFSTGLYHNDSGRFIYSCYALTSVAHRGRAIWKCPKQG
ncbi:Receptor expression-enhancing protein 1-like [Homarus americanus]|uniref:Receptor expression-enhancing protein 1-like n=1 Tax=Homarus americanus TaxID=6706 RepID=A0A8J5MXS8_HOMAM|nr:Receptor expression-enhancing protein 1-like [Homarus americanus]